MRKLFSGLCGTYVGRSFLGHILSSSKAHYSKHLAGITPSFATSHNVAIIVGFMIMVNFFKWIIFGSLTKREIKSLRNKFNYTLWEIFLSLMVIRFVSNGGAADGDDLLLFDKMMIAKFAFLFSCVLLLKFFHYLCVYRVSNVFNVERNDADKKLDAKEEESDSFDEFDDLSTYTAHELSTSINKLYLISQQFRAEKMSAESLLRVTDSFISSTKTSPITHLRFAMGILILNLIDVVLIYKFKCEVYDHGNRNILIVLFGFEIINFYPLIILTSFAYILNYFEFRSNKTLFKKFLANLNHEVANGSSKEVIQTYYSKFLTQKHKNLIAKKKNLLGFKFFLSNMKLLNQILFSIHFLQHYTVPLHTLSHSYISIRILINKMRLLINLKKFEMRLVHFADVLDDADVEDLQLREQTTCLICRTDYWPPKDENPLGDSVKQLKCGHHFHETCIISWLMKTNSCPVCHTKI
ncbi:hypothetical protein DASC09_048860 [Saccharomycopsis crataegensis]|uniref:RING-type domain-containing protein n=1 Tax=Saccharomycopsis crataegensis TaxID=43959 RepID=A0AAV5QSL2_9ASCO|nr:hypothetical protein DASC09_048860 [Saccharomycopsis crataegensis]